MRRLALVVLLAVLATPGPASADDHPLGDDGDVGQPADPPSPTPTINDSSATIAVSFRADLQVVSSQTGRPGRQAECGFFDVTGDQFYTITITPVTPEDRDLPYIIHCWYLDTGASVPGFPDAYFCCDPGLPGGTVVNEWQVAEYAAATIDFAVPAFETSPAGDQVVGVRTWLAVTSQLDFAPVNAAAGPIWATIIPEFREAEWDLGNGETVTCTTDATTVWDPDAGDDQTTDCGYVFTTNDDGEPLQGAVTVTWDLYWTHADPNNPGGAIGPALWGDISQTTIVDFNVRELQAVID